MARDGTAVTSVSIPHTTYPRDLRGRLWIGHDGDWKAFLPGIQCTGAQQLQPPMACHDSDDPWFLTEKYKAFYNSARNHFYRRDWFHRSRKSFPSFYYGVAATTRQQRFLGLLRYRRPAFELSMDRQHAYLPGLAIGGAMPWL